MIPVLHILGMVVPTCKPCPWQIKVRGSEVPGHPEVGNEFKVSLGYMTLSSNTEIN